jgi:hypothetical protein
MIVSGPPGREIRLSAVVMTHPARLAEAHRLRDLHPDLDLRVAIDPSPDRKGYNLDAARTAWSAVADRATHHLVIEDDVILCRGFLHRVLELISAQPRAAVSLFAEWGSLTASLVRVAATAGIAFAEVVDLHMPHLALVLPAEVARGFDGFAATAIGPKACDIVMLRYLRRAGVDRYVSIPGLIEHRQLPSIVGPYNDRQGRRQAACFLPEVTGPVPGEAVLAGLGVVPNLAWTTASVVFEHRIRGEESADELWMPVPAAELLADRGMADPALSGEFRAAVAAIGDLDRVCDRVGDRALRALWTTAYSLGLMAASTGRLPGDPAGEPVARAALGTLAPGGLRRLVPGADLDWLSGQLAPLTLAAVGYALSEARAGRAELIDGPGVSSRRLKLAETF